MPTTTKRASGSRFGLRRKIAAPISSETGKQENLCDGGRELTRKSYLPFLPLELFLEIASYLLPDDLLRLSRVCHELRCLSLSKQSRRVWSACIAHSGLPPCPTYLSEPKYAALVYENICDVCGKSCIRKSIFYLIRIRLCDPFFDQNMKPALYVASEFAQGLMTGEWFLLLPVLTDGSYVTPLSAVMGNPTAAKVFVPEYQKVLEKYKELSRPETMKERGELVVQRCQLNSEVYQHWDLLEGWVLRRDRYERIEATKRRNVLVEGVLNDLKDFGFSYKDWSHFEDACQERWDRLLGLDYTEPVKLKSQELENLVSELAAVIKDDIRLKAEKRRDLLMKDRVREISNHYVKYLKNTLFGQDGEDVTMPRLSTILGMQPIIDLMEAKDYAKRIYAPVWKMHLPGLQPFLEDYREALVQRHRKTIEEWNQQNDPNYLKRDRSGADQLYLATSFFCIDDYCGPYHIPSGNPAIIGVRKNPKWFEASVDIDSIPEDTSFTSVQVHSTAIEVAKALLKDLGLSENTSMSEILRSTEDRILCESCHKDTKTLTNWPLMVRHYSNELLWYEKSKAAADHDHDSDIKLINDHSLTGSKPLIRVIKKKDMPKYAHIHNRHRLGDLRYPGMSIEDDAEDELQGYESGRYRCTLCEKIGAVAFDSLMTRAHVMAHIQSKHGKLAVEDSDYRLEIDPVEE